MGMKGDKHDAGRPESMRDGKGEEMTVYLHSLAHFHPENKIDNRFLEQLDIGTDNEWIVSRTGIRTRHTVLPLDYICATRNRDPRRADEASIYSNAETGCRAASMALGRAGLAASDIGMVIAGGSAPRMGSPAEACLIADRLGISAPCFDLNSACSTFVAQLRLLAMMDTAVVPDFILLVHPENLTRTVDYSDRRTAVLIGDCTTAAIVSHRVPASVQIGPVTMESNPAAWRKVSVPAMGHLQQDGAAVQNFAIRKMSALVEHLRPRRRVTAGSSGTRRTCPCCSRSARGRESTPPGISTTSTAAEIAAALDQRPFSPSGFPGSVRATMFCSRWWAPVSPGPGPCCIFEGRPCNEPRRRDRNRSAGAQWAWPGGVRTGSAVRAIRNPLPSGVGLVGVHVYGGRHTGERGPAA